MGNYKTNRTEQVNLRISNEELSLLDGLVSKKSSYFNKKSRTDIIVQALKLMENFNYNTDKEVLEFSFTGVKFCIKRKLGIAPDLINSVHARQKQTEIPAFNILVSVNDEYRLIV
jgi:hypothetical protein